MLEFGWSWWYWWWLWWWWWWRWWWKRFLLLIAMMIDDWCRFPVQRGVSDDDVLYGIGGIGTSRISIFQPRPKWRCLRHRHRRYFMERAKDVKKRQVKKFVFLVLNKSDGDHHLLRYFDTIRVCFSMCFASLRGGFPNSRRFPFKVLLWPEKWWFPPQQEQSYKKRCLAQ